MSDLLFLWGLMVLAFGLAYAAIRWTVGLLVKGRLADVGRLRWLPLLVPIGAAVLAEAITGKWDGTPGGAGTGPLTVVEPMLVSGVVAGAAAVLLRRLGSAVPERARAACVATALAITLLTLALYWLWPAPEARLF